MGSKQAGWLFLKQSMRVGIPVKSGSGQVVNALFIINQTLTDSPRVIGNHAAYASLVAVRGWSRFHFVIE